MYNSNSDFSKHFHALHTVVLWAGWLGVCQSIVWIGLTLTAILAYNCLLSVASTLTYGSLTSIVFVDLYFKGSCTPNGYQSYNSTMLQSVPTVLDSTQIFIWNSVYLGIAVCWLISSIFLLKFLSRDSAKKSIIIISAWTFCTGAVSLMDLGLGVIFGIDAVNFSNKAYDFHLNPLNGGGIIDPNAVQLLAGEIVAFALLVISFKGFALWLINVGLVIYMTIRLICIQNDYDTNDTLFVPRKSSNSFEPSRTPIEAYEEQNVSVYINDNFKGDSNSLASISPVEINEDAILRAAQMSRDSRLIERHFRNLDTYKQYPPPPETNVKPNIQSGHKSVQLKISTAEISGTATNFPSPDYSPQLTRNHYNYGKGDMRTSRF